MLPIKMDLTKELSTKLRELRINTPVDGEILTAENLSKAIGNNRAWMSQIESRRLKKIKREDVIAIYKLLFNLSTDQEAENKAELDLLDFIIKKSVKHIVSNDEKYTSSDTTFINKPNQISHSSCDMIHDALLSLYDSSSSDEQKKLTIQLMKLSIHIGRSRHTALTLLCDIPFHLCEYASEEELKIIIDKANQLSLELSKQKYKEYISDYGNSINSLEEILMHKFSIFSHKTIELTHRCFNLLLGILFHSSSTLTDEENATLLNRYIYLLQLLAQKNNIEFSLSAVDDNAPVDELKEAINYIQSFLNTISGSTTYYLNQATDYFSE